MIARDHDHFNAGVTAFLECGGDFWARRIFKADESCKGHLRFRATQLETLGQLAPGEGENAQTFAEFFDKLAIHSPEMAAETIVNGVGKGRARIVVGWEAKAVDVLARIMGPSYQRVVAAGVAKFFPWAK